MPKYFKVVSEKISESVFFFELMEKSNNPLMVFKMRNYLSAFLSSSRSITFSIQYYIADNEEMKSIYEEVQASLKKDDVAKYFLNARNYSQKTGYYPITSGGIINSTPDGGANFHHEFDRSFWQSNVSIPKGDVIEICRSYLKTLLIHVSKFYINFGKEIDYYYQLSSEHLLKSKLDLEKIETEYDFEHGILSNLEQIKIIRKIQNETVVCHMDKPYFKYTSLDRYGIA